MPRPTKCRTVSCDPTASYFKPRGVPVRKLGEVTLTLDELEAVRLADLEGMYQDHASSLMGISRQTFGNIIVSAHRKIADALLNAKALRIDGGTYVRAEITGFRCCGCRHVWQIAPGSARPAGCPHCRGSRIHPHGHLGGRA